MIKETFRAEAHGLHEGPRVTRRQVTIEHIRIDSALGYDVVRMMLERLPRFDNRIRALLHHGKATRVKAELEKLEDVVGLTLFSVATHGDWLEIRDGRRNAIQFVIGNVLISTQMTRHVLATGLYAPLRIMLYENDDGTATLEYDRPSTLFGQFGDGRVTAVAQELDRKIHGFLLRAATPI